MMGIEAALATIDSQMAVPASRPRAQDVDDGGGTRFSLSPHEDGAHGTQHGRVNLLHDLDDEQNKANCRHACMAMCKLLKHNGRGSLLRGWRNELDPDCWLYLTIPQLCEAAGKLHFSDDVEMLYGVDDDLDKFTLDELSPEHAAFLDRFKVWVKEQHCGPKGFIESLCADAAPSLSAFKNFARSRGFEATEEELHEIFCMCDPAFKGHLQHDDVVFLETDEVVRDLEHFKIKTRHKDQRQRYLATVYNFDKNLPVAAHHRLAPRAWNQTQFEKLPTVIAQRRDERSKDLRRQSCLAFAQFTKELREQHGSEAKAWRRVMDPNGTFNLSQAKLRRYCRQMMSAVDVNALWRYLDNDGDGSIGIEELCPQLSAHLASFYTWARQSCGSCAGVWDHLDIKSCSSWPSDKNIQVGAFGAALKSLGWPLAANNEARNAVVHALDVRACGFVVKSDLEWLDKWDPPEWMCTDPDPAAWADLFALFTKVYKHPLAAWRRVLDTDDSNHISWAEFKRACEKVKFQGNVGGAWRALDQDLSGFVSMREYDEKSAETLSSFKIWVEANFGSVKLAFKAIDRDGSGSVSLPELRRVCQEYRWQGDVRELFSCLDRDVKKDVGLGENAGKTSLSFAEISFLDKWSVEPSDEKNEDAEFVAKSVSISAPDSPGITRSGGFQSIQSPSSSVRLKPVSPLARGNSGPARKRAPIAGNQSMAMTAPDGAWPPASAHSSCNLQQMSKTTGSPFLSKSRSAPAIKPYVSPYDMPV